MEWIGPDSSLCQKFQTVKSNAPPTAGILLENLSSVATPPAPPALPRIPGTARPPAGTDPHPARKPGQGRSAPEDPPPSSVPPFPAGRAGPSSAWAFVPATLFPLADPDTRGLPGRARTSPPGPEAGG